MTKQRFLVFTVIALAAVPGLYAQRGGRGGGGAAPVVVAPPARSYGISPAGFGNSLFPGGVPGHATALGATVRGVAPGYGGVAPGRPGFPSRGGGAGRPGQRTIILPYAVPVYGGVGYGYGYGYDQFYSTPTAMPVEPVPAQPPVVIINQAYQPDTINPQVREYTNLPPAPQQEPSSLKVYQNTPKPVDDKPTIFLIAMKDGNIMPALSYWVEDDTLNYITRDSDHNRVSLDRVDRSFSMRLNEERGLEFRIPERRPIQ